MRIDEKVMVYAPREAVWDYVTDPANYTGFFEGLTRFDVEGEPAIGLGARYRMLIRIGSADVGGLVEVVEFTPPGDMAWSSVTGVDQRARWRLRDAGNDRTIVNFRFAYGVAGAGISGMIAERVAARPLAKGFRNSLRAMKDEVEALAPTAG